MAVIIFFFFLGNHGIDLLFTLHTYICLSLLVTCALPSLQSIVGCMNENTYFMQIY